MLVVADAAGEGEVWVFDLDDRRVATRFTFDGLDGGWADAGGIALAGDSSLWVPDAQGGCVRRFSLFGNEVGRVGPAPGHAARDCRGLLVCPRAVRLDAGERLWITCGDRPWVHGLQVFSRDGRFLLSACAFGQRRKTFGPALGLDYEGRNVWVADTGNDCIQCFRDDGSFVAAHRLPDGVGRPMAVAAWPAGRAVLVARPRPAVLLFDRDFRRSAAVSLPDGEQLRGPSALLVHGDHLLVLDRDGERVLSFGIDGRFDEVVFDRQEW